MLHVTEKDRELFDRIVGYAQKMHQEYERNASDCNFSVNVFMDTRTQLRIMLNGTEWILDPLSINMGLSTDNITYTDNMSLQILISRSGSYMGLELLVSDRTIMKRPQCIRSTELITELAICCMP